MKYQRVTTHLAETMSKLDVDKAMRDDYAKCILADPQILANIVKVIVPEFREYSIKDIIPCIGETIVSLTVPEKLCIKIESDGTEDVDIKDGKIIYDIRFPLYYNNRTIKILVNIEAQKSISYTKLGYHIESRMVYYMARLVSSQKNVEFIKSNYDDIKDVYSIWICMDTKKSEDSIIEFGMKSSLIYGKIKKIPQIDKLNGALINVRTRATKNKKQSKNKLIGMLEELFSKSEFIEKKKILEEDYGLKMSMELEGRMSEMCNVSDYWEEVATEEGKEIGERQKIISQVVKKLQKDKSVAEIADDLEEKEEVIAPIYEAALSMKPDYDVEKIYELLEKNKKLA